MKVRMDLAGKGTATDPFRVPYPTWQALHVDYQAHYMIVEIPDYTHHNPKDIPEEAFSDLTVKVATKHDEQGNVTETEDVTHTRVLTSIDSKHHTLWYKHLDKMYDEHKGEYRHRVV